MFSLILLLSCLCYQTAAITEAVENNVFTNSLLKDLSGNYREIFQLYQDILRSKSNNTMKKIRIENLNKLEQITGDFKMKESSDKIVSTFKKPRVKILHSIQHLKDKLISVFHRFGK